MLGSSGAHVVERDARHLGGCNGPAALLLEELPQVRAREPEHSVLRELRLGRRGAPLAGARPVDVARGEAAGLEVGGHEQHAVVALAARLTTAVVEPADLGQQMATQASSRPGSLR